MTFKNREIQLDSGWRFPEEMSEVLDTDETMHQKGGRACRRKRAASDVGVEAVLRHEHAWLLMERVMMSHIWTNTAKRCLKV